MDKFIEDATSVTTSASGLVSLKSVAPAVPDKFSLTFTSTAVSGPTPVHILSVLLIVTAEPDKTSVLEQVL